LTSPQRRLLLWFAIAVTIFAVYWLCLRYLFPGYYAPVSAFDGDFYDYASLRDKTIIQILRFPRPAAYYAMKVLGLGGLKWEMADGIAMALVNIWLTVFLVRRISGSSLSTLPLAAALYSVLLFAHPDFYFEHRHDLPAQASYLFAIVSLLCWRALRTQRGNVLRIGLLCLAVASVVLFVFSKETYFVSILCLALGFTLIDRKNWRWNIGYIVLLVALEGASFLWNAHLKGPFVNAHATADDPYRIDVSPAVLANTTWFYLHHFLNPFLIALVAWVIFLLRKDRKLLLLAASFVVAGFAALAPHALLPNHLLEEYAWVGVPLLFAPVLLIGDKLWPLSRNTWVAALLLALAIWAPLGYRANYKSAELAFSVRQDQLGRHIARSVAKLHGIPDGSRVLVAGLEATYIPFYMEDFILTEFGEHTSWTLLTGPGIPPRRNTRVTKIINVADAQLDSYDYLASYDSEGNLLSIRKIGDISPMEQQQPYLLVPELRPFAELVTMYPREAYRKYLAANVCLDWGLLDEAQRYLNDAAALGGASDPTYQQLSARLTELLRQKNAAAAGVISLTAQPQHVIDTDGSGLGVTELIWTISPPRPCEIRVNAPDGKLFATATTSGSSKTDKWVRDGMTFFLQDVSGGRSLAPENTLAKVAVQVTR